MEITGDVGQLDPATLAQSKSYHPIASRGEIDRWILSEQHRTTAAVIERMDAYDNYGACTQVNAFVDALSNWYVRRSRDRFWSGEATGDKTDAYWTLYECLVTTAKLVAPFVPFLSDAIWQNLAVGCFGDRVLESVHLCDFPVSDGNVIDELLSQRMADVREIVSLGRSARMGAKLKVRQPLAKVEVILADTTHQAWLEEHAELIAEELNVKQVDFTSRADEYIDYTVLPDLKRLGPRLGRLLPQLKKALSDVDPATLLSQLDSEATAVVELPDGPVTLDREDIQVRLTAKPGWAAAQGNTAVVVLATEITEELRQEGLARELVHAVQNRRKELDCQYTDRIVIGIETDDADLQAAIEVFAQYIRGETLALRIVQGPLDGVEPVELKVGGQLIKLCVKGEKQS